MIMGGDSSSQNVPALTYVAQTITMCMNCFLFPFPGRLCGHLALWLSFFISRPVEWHPFSSCPVVSSASIPCSVCFLAVLSPCCWFACSSACLFAFPPACMLVCLPACFYACLPACLPACLLVCLPACLFACLFACLPARLLVCLPACLFACRWTTAVTFSSSERRWTKQRRGNPSGWRARGRRRRTHRSIPAAARLSCGFCSPTCFTNM